MRQKILKYHKYPKIKISITNFLYKKNIYSPFKKRTKNAEINKFFVQKCAKKKIPENVLTKRIFRIADFFPLVRIRKNRTQILLSPDYF